MQVHVFRWCRFCGKFYNGDTYAHTSLVLPVCGLLDVYVLQYWNWQNQVLISNVKYVGTETEQWYCSEVCVMSRHMSQFLNRIHHWNKNILLLWNLGLSLGACLQHLSIRLLTAEISHFSMKVSRSGLWPSFTADFISSNTAAKNQRVQNINKIPLNSSLLREKLDDLKNSEDSSD